VYLARQLVDAGHEVTLYTRGKKAITSKIADDSEWGYQKFASSVKHIAGDRQVRETTNSRIFQLQDLDPKAQQEGDASRVTGSARSMPVVRSTVLAAARCAKVCDAECTQCNDCCMCCTENLLQCCAHAAR
jgi:hypothetical protein